MLNDSPSRRFAHWDYFADTRALVHRRSGERISLDAVLTNGGEMMRCIFAVHDKPWGDPRTLDELVELLGTYFKGEQLVQPMLAAV